MSKKILYSYQNDIKTGVDGWLDIAMENKAFTYNKFEGYYENKGGRLDSPVFSVENNDCKFMKLSYEYATPADNPSIVCCGVFFYGKNGEEYPDMYDSLDNTNGEFKADSRVFYGRENAVNARVFFQTRVGVSVRNVCVSEISPEEAAQWCDDAYGKLPELEYQAPEKRLINIPKTIEAMKTGKKWRIVMLGDSIINDTFNSNFQALLKRQYSDSNLDVICSVRGSTGCWFYKEKENFKEYVENRKPDLLIIGGISNAKDCTDEDAANYIDEVITNAKENIGCEVMLLTGPLGNSKKEFNNSSDDYKVPFEFWNLLEEIAENQKIEFQNQGIIWRDYILKNKNYIDMLYRDSVHGNRFGEQIIARMIEKYFQPK